MDPQLYRSRQRRRAAIGWTALIVVVALVVVGIAVGSDGSDRGGGTEAVGIFTASMTSDQYDALRNGEEESVVYRRLGSVGMGPSEVQESLLALFPTPPGDSNCAYWFLSDAPEHLVRLCFDAQRGVLVQKSVAAEGEGEAPTTLT